MEVRLTGYTHWAEQVFACKSNVDSQIGIQKDLCLGQLFHLPELTRLSGVFILSTFQYRLSKRPAKAKHPEGLRFTLTTYSGFCIFFVCHHFVIIIIFRNIVVTASRWQPRRILLTELLGLVWTVRNAWQSSELMSLAHAITMLLPVSLTERVYNVVQFSNLIEL